MKVEEIFKPGDIVEVTGHSKGKGFAGVVKRHNFRGGPKTHGQSDRWRAPGSIGQTTTPGRVYRGKKMAGRMGQDAVTVKNLKIVDVDPVTKILSVSGPVPGAKRSIVFINRIGEDKKFVSIHKLEESREAPKEQEVSQVVSGPEEVKEVKAQEKPEVIEKKSEGEAV